MHVCNAYCLQNTQFDVPSNLSDTIIKSFYWYLHDPTMRRALGLLLFWNRSPRTPTFKMLVRTLSFFKQNFVVVRLRTTGKSLFVGQATKLWAMYWADIFPAKMSWCVMVIDQVIQFCHTISRYDVLDRCVFNFWHAAGEISD